MKNMGTTKSERKSERKRKRPSGCVGFLSLFTIATNLYYVGEGSQAKNEVMKAGNAQQVGREHTRKRQQ